MLRINKHMADRPGTYTTEAIYDSIVTAPVTDMFVCQKEGKWGVINSSGEEILKMEYEYFSTRDWKERPITYLVFWKERVWHCVDRTGKINVCSDVGIVPGSANESVRKL